MSVAGKRLGLAFGVLAMGVAMTCATGCTTTPTQLLVSVKTTDAGLPPIHQFMINVTGASVGTMTRTLPEAPAAVPYDLPTQLVAVLPNSGTFTLVVYGLDANGREVARGDLDNVEAVGNAIVEVTVMFRPALWISGGPTYDFDSQPVGSQTQKKFTVINLVEYTITLGSLTTGDVGLAAPFSLIPGGTCQSGTRLVPFASCTLAVNFAPMASGPASDLIELGYHDGITGRVASRALVATGRLTEWTNQLGTPAIEEGYGVATDNSGNVYVTGRTRGAFDGSQSAGAYDLFLVKYSSSGSKLWTRQFGTPMDDYASGVATDDAGNVYVTGYTSGGLDGQPQPGNDDAFLVKYDAAGTRIWTRQFGTTTSGDVAYGVATDGAGNIYVTGYTAGALDGNLSAGNPDLFLVSYDGAGNRRWMRQLGTASEDIGTGVASDRAGNVYVTGYTAGGLDGNPNKGRYDLFLVGYDHDGMKLGMAFQLGTDGDDVATGIATDRFGNIYVTGYTSGVLDGGASAGGYDVFLIKNYGTGQKLWTRQLGTASTDSGQGVATDSAGNVYVTGYTKSALDANQNAGEGDMFLVKYSSAGNKLWTRQYGTTAADFAHGVATDGTGNVYVAGHTFGSAGFSDLLLLKFLATP